VDFAGIAAGLINQGSIGSVDDPGMYLDLRIIRPASGDSFYGDSGDAGSCARGTGIRVINDVQRERPTDGRRNDLISTRL
jgi:hypothetical protein